MYFQNIDTLESFISIYSPEKFTWLFFLKEIKPSPDRKMIKLFHLITCFRHYDNFTQTRGRMTTAI